MQNSQHRRKPSENSSVVFEVTDEELENFSGGILGVRSITPSTSALMSGHSTSVVMSSGTSVISLSGSHL
jgi:hypothetical protein